MKATLFLVLGLFFFLGCKQGVDKIQPRVRTPEDSIRLAIEAHLAHKGNLNLQAFDMELKQVSIQGDHATAEVEFRVKGGPGAMQLGYALESHDGVWSVVESDPVGSNFSHPSLGQGQNQAVGNPGANPSLADTLKAFGAGVGTATR